MVNDFFRSGGATSIVTNLKNCPSRERLLKLHGRWKSDLAKDMYVKEQVVEFFHLQYCTFNYLLYLCKRFFGINVSRRCLFYPKQATQPVCTRSCCLLSLFFLAVSELEGKYFFIRTNLVRENEIMFCVESSPFRLEAFIRGTYFL